MKNKIIIILLMLIFVCPVFSEENICNNGGVATKQNVEEVVLGKKSATDNINFKQPVSKKNLAKKFLLAMSGVGISALLIFLILGFFKRVRIINQKNIENEKEDSLYTPEDLNSAIKKFLEKTDWN